MMQDTHSCCRIKQMFWVGMWIGMAGLAVTLVSSFMQSTTMADAKTAKALRHVVQFQFKESSSKDDIQKVVDGFRALPAKFPQWPILSLVSITAPKDWPTDLLIASC